MRADNRLRTSLLKTLGEKAYKNPHVYKRRVADGETTATRSDESSPPRAPTPRPSLSR